MNVQQSVRGIRNNNNSNSNIQLVVDDVVSNNNKHISVPSTSSSSKQQQQALQMKEDSDNPSVAVLVIDIADSNIKGTSSSKSNKKGWGPPVDGGI